MEERSFAMSGSSGDHSCSSEYESLGPSEDFDAEGKEAEGVTEKINQPKNISGGIESCEARRVLKSTYPLCK